MMFDPSFHKITEWADEEAIHVPIFVGYFSFVFLFYDFLWNFAATDPEGFDFWWNYQESDPFFFTHANLLPIRKPYAVVDTSEYVNILERVGTFLSEYKILNKISSIFDNLSGFFESLVTKFKHSGYLPGCERDLTSFELAYLLHFFFWFFIFLFVVYVVFLYFARKGYRFCRLFFAFYSKIGIKEGWVEEMKNDISGFLYVSGTFNSLASQLLAWGFILLICYETLTNYNYDFPNTREVFDHLQAELLIAHPYDTMYTTKEPEDLTIVEVLGRINLGPFNFGFDWSELENANTVQKLFHAPSPSLGALSSTFSTFWEGWSDVHAMYSTYKTSQLKKVPDARSAWGMNIREPEVFVDDFGTYRYFYQVYWMSWHEAAIHRSFLKEKDFKYLLAARMEYLYGNLNVPGSGGYHDIVFGREFSQKTVRGILHERWDKPFGSNNEPLDPIVFSSPIRRIHGPSLMNKKYLGHKDVSRFKPEFRPLVGPYEGEKFSLLNSFFYSRDKEDFDPVFIDFRKHPGGMIRWVRRGALDHAKELERWNDYYNDPSPQKYKSLTKKYKKKNLAWSEEGPEVVNNKIGDQKVKKKKRFFSFFNIKDNLTRLSKFFKRRCGIDEDRPWFGSEHLRYDKYALRFNRILQLQQFRSEAKKRFKFTTGTPFLDMDPRIRDAESNPMNPGKTGMRLFIRQLLLDSYQQLYGRGLGLYYYVLPGWWKSKWFSLFVGGQITNKGISLPAGGLVVEEYSDLHQSYYIDAYSSVKKIKEYNSLFEHINSKGGRLSRPLDQELDFTHFRRVLQPDAWLGNVGYWMIATRPGIFELSLPYTYSFLQKNLQKSLEPFNSLMADDLDWKSSLAVANSVYFREFHEEISFHKKRPFMNWNPMSHYGLFPVEVDHAENVKIASEPNIGDDPLVVLEPKLKLFYWHFLNVPSNLVLFSMYDQLYGLSERSHRHTTIYEFGHELYLNSWIRLCKGNLTHMSFFGSLRGNVFNLNDHLVPGQYFGAEPDVKFWRTYSPVHKGHRGWNFFDKSLWWRYFAKRTGERMDDRAYQGLTDYAAGYFGWNYKKFQKKARDSAYWQWFSYRLGVHERLEQFNVSDNEVFDFNKLNRTNISGVESSTGFVTRHGNIFSNARSEAPLPLNEKLTGVDDRWKREPWRLVDLPNAFNDSGYYPTGNASWSPLYEPEYLFNQKYHAKRWIPVHVGPYGNFTVPMPVKVWQLPEDQEGAPYKMNSYTHTMSYRFNVPQFTLRYMDYFSRNYLDGIVFSMFEHEQLLNCEMSTWNNSWLNKNTISGFDGLNQGFLSIGNLKQSLKFNLLPPVFDDFLSQIQYFIGRYKYEVLQKEEYYRLREPYRYWHLVESLLPEVERWKADAKSFGKKDVVRFFWTYYWPFINGYFNFDADFFMSGIIPVHVVPEDYPFQDPYWGPGSNSDVLVSFEATGNESILPFRRIQEDGLIGPLSAGNALPERVSYFLPWYKKGTWSTAANKFSGQYSYGVPFSTVSNHVDFVGDVDQTSIDLIHKTNAHKFVDDGLRSEFLRARSYIDPNAIPDLDTEERNVENIVRYQLMCAYLDGNSPYRKWYFEDDGSSKSKFAFGADKYFYKYSRSDTY